MTLLALLLTAVLPSATGDLPGAATCPLVEDVEWPLGSGAQADEPLVAQPERLHGAPDPACLIDPSSLPTDALIVDVRLPGQSDRFWLTDSLREASIEAIARRPTFAAAPLVLVGTGKDDLRISAYCAGLAEATGQPVHVVRGGLRALALAGFAHEGDTFALDALSELTTSELHAILETPGLRLLDASDASHPVVAELPVRARRAQRDQLRQALASMPAASLPVLVLAPGESLGAWLDAAGAHRGRLLVYRAGWPAYAEFRLQHQRTLAAREWRPPQRCRH